MGGVLGGGSDSSSKQSSSSGVDPLQQEFRKRLYYGALGQVSGLDIEGQPGQFYGGKLQYYPDSTVANRSDLQNYSDDLEYSLLQGGDPNFNLSKDYNYRTLSGQYLDPNSNPYLRGTYDNAAKAVTDNFNRTVQPNIASRFARSGQSLSSGLLAAQNRSQDALGDDLRRLATDVYGENYRFERGRQDAARDYSRNFVDQQYQGIDRIRQAGERRQGFNQQVLDDMVRRFEFDRDEPFTRLARYSNLIGQPVLTSTSSGRSTGSTTEGIFGVIGRLLGF